MGTPEGTPSDAIPAPATAGGGLLFVPTKDGLEVHVNSERLVYSATEDADQLMRAAQVGWELTQLKRGLP